MNEKRKMKNNLRRNCEIQKRFTILQKFKNYNKNTLQLLIIIELDYIQQHINQMK